MAHDLVHFQANLNDQVDVASYFLHDIWPGDGSSPIYHYVDGESVLSDVDFLKSQFSANYNNALIYYNMLKTYTDYYDNQTIIDALYEIGVDAVAFKADLVSMKNAMLYVKNNIASATTKEDLDTLGTHIDTNVPKLYSVRRPWAVI